MNIRKKSIFRLIIKSIYYKILFSVTDLSLNIKNINSNGVCPICSSADSQAQYELKFFGSTLLARLLLRHHAAQLFNCMLCDFGYFYPRSNLEFINNFYSNQGGGRSSKPDAEELKEISNYVNANEVRINLSILSECGVPLHDKTLSILEIGSGYSSFIPAVHKLGLSVYANDMDKESLDFNSRHFNTVPINCSLGDIPPKFDNHFDLIYSKDSLEHHVDPSASLLRMMDLLRPGGFIFLSIPNLNSITFQKSILFHPYFSYPAHLNYFSIYTLDLFMSKNGLKVLYSNTETSIGEYLECSERLFISGLLTPKNLFLNQAHEKMGLERITFLAQKLP